MFAFFRDHLAASNIVRNLSGWVYYTIFYGPIWSLHPSCFGQIVSSTGTQVLLYGTAMVSRTAASHPFKLWQARLWALTKEYKEQLYA